MPSQSSCPAPCSLFSVPLLSLFLPLLLLLVLTSAPATQALDISKLCQARCYRGRGGNLCNCNAFHFAGKRAGEVETLRLPSSPLLELALRGMKHVEARRAPGVMDTSPSLSGSRLASRGRVGEEGAEEGRREAGGLFDAKEEGERSAAAAAEEVVVNRLTSLIRSALDERLIDTYDGSRKRNQGTLPYEEADFVY